MINECSMKDCFEPVYAITGLLNDERTMVNAGHHCLGHYQEWCTKIARDVFALNGISLMKDGKLLDTKWMDEIIFMETKT